jgi:hypothetical protein
LTLTNPTAKALMAIVTDQNSPQKHVWQTPIVLLTSDGCATMELTCCTGTSKTAAWPWQRRSFLWPQVSLVCCEKTRPSRIPPLGAEVEARLVAATQTAAPGETTHWTSIKWPNSSASASIRWSASR